MIFWSVPVRVNPLLKVFTEGHLGGGPGTPPNISGKSEFSMKKHSFQRFATGIRGGSRDPPNPSGEFGKSNNILYHYCRCDFS